MFQAVKYVAEGAVDQLVGKVILTKALVVLPVTCGCALDRRWSSIVFMKDQERRKTDVSGNSCFDERTGNQKQTSFTQCGTP